jgi:hypothetical protein
VVLEDENAADQRRAAQDLDGLGDSLAKIGIDQQGVRGLRDALQQVVLFLQFFLRDLLIGDIPGGADQL